MWNVANSAVLFIYVSLHLGVACAHKIKVADVNGAKPVRFMALTFVTHATEGFERLLRSSEAYGVDLNVIKIKPVDYWKSTGCEIFLNVRQFVERYKNEKDLIILLIDGYDVVFNGGTEEIVNKFYEFDANIVFGAEDPGFPNIGMQYIFPKELEGYKGLNGGMIIGYAPHMHALLQYRILFGNRCNDQLHLARLFTDPLVQEGLKMKLDHKAKLMQNLVYIPYHDYQLVMRENDTQFINVRFQTKPALLHGNGLDGKYIINSIGNYVGKAWTKSEGCTHCNDGIIDLSKKSESEYPMVLLGIFVEEKTPFLPEMLKKVSALLYPKSKISLYVYSKVPQQEKLILKWIHSHEIEYLSTKFTPSAENLNVKDAKDLALKTCVEISCDLFFNVDSEVHLDNPDTLQLLISYNRTILSPVMTRPGTYFSTFWGARGRTSPNYWGYERSFDYIDITLRKKMGIWNVPLIHGVYVIWRSVFDKVNFHRKFFGCPDVPDVIFCYNTEAKIFMFAVNYEHYGHLVNTDDVHANERKSDLWQLNTNREDWEDKYLNPNFSQVLKYSLPEKACEEAHHIPVFSDRFCDDFLEAVSLRGKLQPKLELESNNQVDIDLKQLKELDYQEEWLSILQKYIRPLGKQIVEEDQLHNYKIRIAVADGKASDQCGAGDQELSKNVFGTSGDVKRGNQSKLTREIILSRCTPHDQRHTFISLI